MKHAYILAVAALAGIASINATAAETLSIRDVTAAAQRSEHDKNALDKLRGKTIKVDLVKRPKTPYFDTVGDPGLVVLCPQGSQFAGGRVTSTIKKLELDADSGTEFVNVLSLDSCNKAG